MDAYLYWIWSRMREAAVDMTAYPHFARHAADGEARHAIRCALARQSAAVAALAG